MEKRTNLDDLRRFMSQLQPGPVPEDAHTELVRLLGGCWDRFDGIGDTAMKPDKLWRLENLVWNPPVLSFAIERHGGTVSGSTRAELHVWTVNLEHLTAQYEKTGHRQLSPMQARFDVNPVARELSEAIVNRKQDPRLQWSKSGAVRVLTSKVFPPSVKATLAGRRKRLHSTMENLLAPHGWQYHGSWWKPSKRG